MTNTNNIISAQINDLICSGNEIINNYYTVDLTLNKDETDFDIKVTVSDNAYELQILQLQLNTIDSVYLRTVANNIYKKKEEQLKEGFKVLVDRTLKYIQDAILEKIKL